MFRFVRVLGEATKLRACLLASTAAISSRARRMIRRMYSTSSMSSEMAVCWVRTPLSSAYRSVVQRDDLEFKRLADRELRQRVRLGWIDQQAAHAGRRGRCPILVRTTSVVAASSRLPPGRACRDLPLGSPVSPSFLRLPFHLLSDSRVDKLVHTELVYRLPHLRAALEFLELGSVMRLGVDDLLHGEFSIGQPVALPRALDRTSDELARRDCSNRSRSP